MHEEGLVTVQPLARLKDATARVEQQTAFITDVQVNPEVVVLLQEIDNHLPVVVDVDGDVVKACRCHTFDNMLQHGLAGNLHHRFRTVIGQGAQACT